MFTTLRLYLALLLTIYLTSGDTRSIPDGTDAQLVIDPFQKDDPHLSVTLANYRHRFERSMNFKKMRWTLNSLNSTALCDACDLLVPEVTIRCYA
jgi:hypothetical protein